jgi:hypothetical protein
MIVGFKDFARWPCHRHRRDDDVTSFLVRLTKCSECGSILFADAGVRGVTPPFVKNCTLYGEPEVTTAPELV